MSAPPATPSSVIEVLGPIREGYEAILTPAALDFLALLVRSHNGERLALLDRRQSRQVAWDNGDPLRFPTETVDIRYSEWSCAPIPDDLADRRVEITGPVDRKMVINALNSGASCFMADFEDSNAPTWDNCLSGQVNLRDAVARTIEFTNDRGKHYRLNDEVATLLVRPRGLHLSELHLTLDGKALPASLVDFGLYFFHNAKTLLSMGSGPWFYLPKLESYLEARWWNKVFVTAQEALGIPRGTIRATVLIETLPAAFEIDEILHALREHSGGLNCGRWDYIFSAIKTRRADPSALFPDRDQVGMTAPFMEAYTRRVVQLCHKRGVHAMGGMAAQIPIKGDPEANEAALAKVRADKLREVKGGHDGTWVAHPGLVPVAKAIFDAHMPLANQISNVPNPEPVTEAMLLAIPEGTRTEAGLRKNLRVCVQYTAAWLSGNGCVPIANLMEDAATAEISRSQVWQWVRHDATLDDGRTIDLLLVTTLLREELVQLKEQMGDDAYNAVPHELAAKLLVDWTSADPLPDFLTLPATAHLRDTQE